MSGILRFCPECNNILYPSEDKAAKQLHFACRYKSFLFDTFFVFWRSNSRFSYQIFMFWRPNRQCEYSEESAGNDEDQCVFRHDVRFILFYSFSRIWWTFCVQTITFCLMSSWTGYICRPWADHCQSCGDERSNPGSRLSVRMWLLWLKRSCILSAARKTELKKT